MQLPHDRILVETDAPYLAPVPYRGKRNEPVYIEAIIAQAGISKDILLRNTANLFSIVI